MAGFGRWGMRWIGIGLLCGLMSSACDDAPPQPAGGGIVRESAAGNVSAVRGLLRRDPALARQADSFGTTPLHAAAAQGRSAVVKLLLDNKADVNAKAQGGLTQVLASADSKRRSANLPSCITR